MSSVTYPAIWRSHDISRGRRGVSYGRCGCKCGGCASLKEMIPIEWETIASRERDAAPPAGDTIFLNIIFFIADSSYLLVNNLYSVFSAQVIRYEYW
jgi:hypothetical protein